MLKPERGGGVRNYTPVLSEGCTDPGSIEGNWTDHADTAWYDDHLGESSFTISTAEGLAGLAKLVNAGNDFSDKTIKLGNDIDLAGHYWIPIGDESNQFNGTFDGQNHTVSSIYIEIENVRYSPGFAYIGFFGYLNSGEIKDLVVSNSSISVKSYSNDIYVGGIAGYNNGIISNCNYDGKISTKTYNLSSHVGGIIGYSTESGNVSGCNNSGEISNMVNVDNEYSDPTLFTGGIVGENQGDITNCYNYGSLSVNSEDDSDYYLSSINAYTGGICGNNSGSILIENYINDSDINLIFHGIIYVGGICGNNSGSMSISNSVYNGALIAKSIKSNLYVGGICGNNSEEFSAINCSSFSSEIDARIIRGDTCAYIGGIIGYNDSKGIISDCHNSGKISIKHSDGSVKRSILLGGIVGYNMGTILNCYNTGDIESSSSDTSYGPALHTGGIAGDNDGKIINCYNSGNLSTTHVSDDIRNICIGGIAGYNRKTISYCYNTSSIDASFSSIPMSVNTKEQIPQSIRNSYAGGIVGYNYGSITSSYNIGSVSSSSGCSDKSMSLDLSNYNIESYAGGITAYNNSGSSLIENCYNAGDITSSVISPKDADDGSSIYNTTLLFKAYSGGIIGYNFAGKLSNSYNVGDVNSSSTYESQPEHLTIEMSSYAGGIFGYCDSGELEYCYNVGDVSSVYSSSNDDNIPSKSDIFVGGITGYFYKQYSDNPFSQSYYADDCIKSQTDKTNVYGEKGESLSLNQMKGTNLLGDNTGKNLNGGESPQWSFDLYNSNSNLPVLSNTPTQADPEQSIDQPPKSKIYITPATDDRQNDNYLETIVIKHNGTCDLKAHIEDISGYNVISYQWYKLSSTGEFTEIQYENDLELKSAEAGTYCVKVTYEKDQSPVALSSMTPVLGAAPTNYTYTSLTITVVELSEIQKLIEFDSDGGSSVPQQILSEGKCIEKPQNPTKSGYSFLGWYYNETKWDFSGPVSEDMTLTAHWKYNEPYYPPSYTLKLQSNNSSSLYKDYSGSYGASITLPQIDSLGWEYENHTFKNWNTKADGSGTSYSAGDKFTINSNVTLYAQWEEASVPPAVQKVTVTFYIGDEVYKVIEVSTDTSLKDKFPVNPESSDNNSTFKEWNTKADGSGTAFTADSTVNSDTSVYAVWEKSSSSSSNSWWWILIIIIILIIAAAAYYYYKKNQN